MSTHVSLPDGTRWICARAARQRAALAGQLAVAGLAAAAWAGLAAAAEPHALPGLRPPAVPLVAHDPYFSIWSPADRLTDADTIHWTGKPHRLTSLVRIGDKPFRLLGAAPAGVPALPQTGIEVLPTRTVATFEGEGLRVTLTFLTPALPDDLDALARPVTYVTWTLQAIDGRTHAAALYFDAAAELSVHTPDTPCRWEAQALAPGWKTLRAGSAGQPVLRRKGDDVRIDWGYLYLVAPGGQGADAPLAAAPGVLAGAFAAGGLKLAHNVAPPAELPASGLALAAVLDAGNVGADPVSQRVMLAYDDVFAIRYFGSNLRPYWRRGGDDAAAMLRKADAACDALAARCAVFDAELLADLRRAGGGHYAALCALAYRQTWAGNKLAADANGMPLLFPKENFSNGCIATVDVLFPQAPFFLALSPALTKAMLVPVLDYAASPLWPYGYAPHDLGTYPHATGQVYGMKGGDGGRMPVEESGNMLIMLAALARVEGNAALARRYWPLLTRWADYLVANGLDPENQLCSADMFGHLPHCANLALKAIIGIGGYAQLAEALGHADAATRYRAVARDYAAQWMDKARDEGRTRLAYHLPGTWGMKHNLIWDRVLGLNLFPESLGDAEIAWYLKVQKPYGLPVDNRTDTCLIDWAMWSIAPARSAADFEALVAPLFRYANETPSRVPLSDWFVTTDGRQRGFQARPVVGGIYIRLLTGAPAWAARAAPVSGEWAPLPAAAAMPMAEVVPTAERQPVAWRHTLESPAAGWFMPAFDASAWKEAPGGFGTAGTPGAVVRTEWKTAAIWLRREFTLGDAPLKNPHLRAHYDEDATVYLNGVLATELPGWSSEYAVVEMTPEARATLRPGRNVLAAHCRQTWGGQYIDVGIVDEASAGANPAAAAAATVPALPAGLKPLFDFPVRDTCVGRGPDGAYYLTGTTGHPTWWKTNEGIRVWRSKDLAAWEPLGLVWSFAKDATWQKQQGDKRAIWAPELHYFKGTFWIAYCVNYGGTGVLRSRTGRAEGPYEDIKPDGPLTGEIDASLFADDDGTVYFVYQNGKIARFNDAMTGLDEPARLLKPANAGHVGFEGAFIAKAGGRYHLIAAEFVKRDGVSAYDCMAASADRLEGPYGERYLAVPHGGHNMLFRDAQGRWWSTFFGNDPGAPFRERPAVLRVRFDAAGRIAPGE